MNHNDHMTGEEWYHNKRYMTPSTQRVLYDTARSPLELYPGHAAYSGIQWHERKPEDVASQDAEPAGITSILTPGATKESDIVDDLLANKVEAMRQNIEHIAYQLEERERLGKQNQYTIDLTMMKTKEDLFECELWPTGSNQTIEKRRSQLERELQELDREKRFEEISCWKDQQMLLRDMREAATEYDSAIRRKGLLNDSRLTGGGPGPG